jgi:leucyl aminopeptidase (aminopeptidase T)
MSKATEARFGSTATISARLKKAAGVAMGDVVKAGKGERVLIITNPNHDVHLISMALYDAALARGAEPTLVLQPPKSQFDFAEDAVIHALRSGPEIILSVSRHKLGKDRFALKKPYKHKGKSIGHIFNYLIESKKSRSFWSPSVTVEMFERTVPIDYKRLKANCRKLRTVLDRASEVHVTTRAGTDLVIGVRKRKAKMDDGDFSRPGTGGNLPAGEVYISPELGTGDGTIVFDGCIASGGGVILIKKPIVATVKKNMVTGISGGREARALRATFESARKTTRKFAKDGTIPRKAVPEYLKNMYNLGELGIGLNERARIVGNMLEDEKVFKTCHIAIGSNYDGDAEALIHLDGLVKRPTIEVRDAKGRSRLIMKNGDIVI